MFEKLIELLAAGWDYLTPVWVVDVYQGAVVLRLGKWVRTIGPGLHWKWPLVERVIEETTCLTTLRLPPQTLTTQDGKSIVVAAIVKYSVVDVKAYVTRIFDQVDVLADVTLGAIARQVRGQPWDTMCADPPEGKIAADVRRQVKSFGFEIESVTLTDLGRVNSLRLIQPNPINLGN